MFPTQVSKIWLGSLLFLVLWGGLASLVTNRRNEVKSTEQTLSNTVAVRSSVERSLRFLSDMESANRSYLITPRSREPFNNAKNQFSKEYGKLKAFYSNSKSAEAQLDRRFKGTKKEPGPFSRWFGLSNAIVIERNKAGDNPSRALTKRVADGEAERARLLNQARSVLDDYQKAFSARAAMLQRQQSEQESVADWFTHLRTALGILGIGAVAILLARQAGQLGVTNETLRHEIENRRRAERDRQTLADHNEQILNSTTEGIVGLNARGRITFANPSAATMLGWEVAELLGKSWHDIAQHSRGDNTRLDKDASPVMATLRDTNPRRISDDVFWKRTGRTFPVEYAVSPLWELSPNENEDKQLSGATLTFRDITERKRSEIALLRLASVVESSKDAILSHLLDGTIVSCNASAVKMYGYSPRDIEGKPLSVLLPPSRAAEAMLLVEHIARGERIEPYQTTLITKSGAPVDVAITFYPVLDARGNIMGASSNARPIRRDARGNLPTFEALSIQKAPSSANAPSSPANTRPEVGASR